jgi:hypothetical protein
VKEEKQRHQVTKVMDIDFYKKKITLSMIIVEDLKSV